MRVNISGCLLAFVLGCAGSDTSAEIVHEIVEKNEVHLLCARSVEGNLKWSKESNGTKVDILTVASTSDKDIKHINDPSKRYNSLGDKSLYIMKVTVSDSGTYYCNDEPAVKLTVIPPGVTRETAEEKTNITLKCPHAAVGSDVVAWSKEISGREQNIINMKNGTGKHVKGQGRRYGLTKEMSLTIRTLKHEDSALYYCDGKPAVYLTVIEATTRARTTRARTTRARTTRARTRATTTRARTTRATTIRAMKTKTTMNWIHLLVGMLSAILLIIILFTWRYWSKRRGQDATLPCAINQGGSGEQKVEPIYAEILDGPVVQPAGCGPSQSDHTYSIIPDPPRAGNKTVQLELYKAPYSVIESPHADGQIDESSIPSELMYYLINEPNLKGTNEGTTELSDPTYYLLDKPEQSNESPQDQRENVSFCSH